MKCKLTHQLLQFQSKELLFQFIIYNLQFIILFFVFSLCETNPYPCFPQSRQGKNKEYQEKIKNS